jgi:hypothetical protein
LFVFERNIWTDERSAACRYGRLVAIALLSKWCAETRHFPLVIGESIDVVYEVA